MRRLAIIPAKRRSRRLPDKNVLSFNGKPMFLHSVDAAKDAGLFDRIVVSSDDDEVQRLSSKAGVAVHRRSTELSSDSAGLIEVCGAVLADEAGAGRSYDLLVLLLATAPLRNSQDICDVVALAEKHETGGALAVTSFSHPPHQALQTKEDGSAEAMWPDLIECRSEELPHLTVDNGSTYALHLETFEREQSFFPKQLSVLEMPRARSVDLDDESDLAILNFYAGLGSKSDKDQTS